jgi:hypothetical protein
MAGVIGKFEEDTQRLTHARHDPMGEAAKCRTRDERYKREEEQLKLSSRKRTQEKIRRRDLFNPQKICHIHTQETD